MKTIFLILISTALTLSSQDSIDAIIQKVDNRLQPAYLSAKVILRYNNKLGEKIDERQLYYRRKWQGIESESILIKFISPDEIKNSAFLSITEQNKSSQLFYLPDLGNPRQIKNNKLNSSFMNSDFSFGDLKSWKMADNNNRLLDESEKDYIIESIFHKAWFNQRLVIRIDKKTLFIEEIKYYANGCDYPVRVMKIKKKKELGKYIIPVHIEMTSFKECSQKVISSSEIIYLDWDITTKIDAAFFTQKHMTYQEF